MLKWNLHLTQPQKLAQKLVIVQNHICKSMNFLFNRCGIINSTVEALYERKCKQVGHVRHKPSACRAHRLESPRHCKLQRRDIRVTLDKVKSPNNGDH